jgi:hypothetical protein
VDYLSAESRLRRRRKMAKRKPVALLETECKCLNLEVGLNVVLPKAKSTKLL